jgi:sulfur carrier protein
MIVWINGTSETVSEGPRNLEDLVAARGIARERVVVEHNLRIVPREQWPHVLLQDNDRIEIVSFVGGG